MPDVNTLAPVDQYQEFVFSRLLAEIYLLLDFLSGRATRSLDCLAGIQLADAAADAPTATPDAVIAHVCKLRYPPVDYFAVTASNAAFLLLVKDRLNAATSPANGCTIAFTTMVVGHPDRGRTDGTRTGLAEQAYPGLAHLAHRQWRWNLIGSILIIALTFATAYTGGVVAFGSSLLQKIDATEAMAAAVFELIRNAEGQPPPTPAGGAASDPGEPAPFYRLCDRPKLLRWEHEPATPQPVMPRVPLRANGILPPIDAFDTGSERLICDELDDVNRKLKLEYDDLYRFEWRVMYVYELPIVLVGKLRHWVAGWLGVADDQDGVPASAWAMGTPEGDQWLSAALAALGNFFLPMLFTILGSAVSIARDLYGRIRTATLDPRDGMLALGRLALGIVAGAAIGLFVAPSPGAGAASAAVPLTASGLAFLAGYGIDAVFSLFDGLLKRFNPNPSDAPANTGTTPHPPATP